MGVMDMSEAAGARYYTLLDMLLDLDLYLLWL